LDKQVEDANLKFMTEFVKKYSEDAQLAKQFYYQTKVEFDIGTDEGAFCRKKMLKKYLEGMQWVLYYYYKGAPHWRWYYPYHYAPMISDLGINIVQDFLGTTTIREFEIDHNCPVNTLPFTPFQQLLCIMPIRSFKLLPPQFLEIPQRMDASFPSNFSVDLNGKTNAWEAIVLIPFVDEN
jgi:5'-3' exoribonuclease 1